MFSPLQPGASVSAAHYNHVLYTTPANLLLNIFSIHELLQQARGGTRNRRTARPSDLDFEVFLQSFPLAKARVKFAFAKNTNDLDELQDSPK